MKAREKAAVEILAAGGYFRYQLESDPYTKREQFQVRLRDASGCVRRGFGFATFLALKAKGVLAYRECERSSAWPSEYVLREELA